MTSELLHLPDGKKITVTPVFGGMGFRSHHHHHDNLLHPFPVGWMTVLHTEEEPDDFDVVEDHDHESGIPHLAGNVLGEEPRPKRRSRPFRAPTLQNDTLFISSLSLPSNAEYKPAASPTREIAMMLWITLYWYFHQPEPDFALDTAACRATPQAARPRGEWKIAIKREGVLRGRNLIPKLERMGLIACDDSSVGTSVDSGDGDWDNLFVTRRMFWQMPAQLFLFSLQPAGRLIAAPGLYSTPGSPITSGSDSPREEIKAWHSRAPSGGGTMPSTTGGQPVTEAVGPLSSTTLSPTATLPLGPYFSSSQLPMYYPPPPLQYTHTNNIRHPLRPKPPRMGEVFYSRYIDSVGQYLSLRVASCSPLPVPYLGPVGPTPPEQSQSQPLSGMSDKELLQSWFRNPRVKEFWGDYESDFLEAGLRSKHSFPVIGLWDGVPFGYFEVYWAKEDILGRHVGSEVADWDRGVHIMIGEEWSRGRVGAWLTSLVHWCFTSDNRTMNVCLEPRVDNKRVLRHLDRCGFSKEKQVSFPHKQSWYVKLRREFWDGPEL
ncbi:hypothetical protein E4U11_004575 [Claviceps purpurea]|nr:hypothetical protein E4U11_004575 [Claviceps purpurea]KAG6307349.1 hypothetical protein E4U45_004943 [Claviceps purpurea]